MKMLILYSGNFIVSPIIRNIYKFGLLNPYFLSFVYIYFRYLIKNMVFHSVSYGHIAVEGA